MNETEFRTAVRRMRRFQIAYLIGRRSGDLIKSKQAEGDVDFALRQSSLFDEPEPPAPSIPEPTNVEPTRKVSHTDDLRAAALEWIRANPEVYATLRTMAVARVRDERCFSLQELAETVRWNSDALGTGGGEPDQFKLNNNHIPYIARQIVADRPEVEPWIRFRKTRS